MDEGFARQYRTRWLKVAEFEREERRKAIFSERWRQFIIIQRFGRRFETPERFEENAEVTECWRRLKQNA